MDLQLGSVEASMARAWKLANLNIMLIQSEGQWQLLDVAVHYS